MSKTNETGVGEYPEKDWDPQFRGLDKPTRLPLIEFDRLPKVPDPKADIRTGLKELGELEQKRTSTQRADILRQAEPTLPAIIPVLEALKISYDGNGDADALIERIRLNVLYPVFNWKVKFGRARPRMKAREFGVTLNPMLEPGHAHHPGHGSYPSGHAALAYCWAELLVTLLKANDKARDAAQEAACWVAHNREIAGVHFPSDSLAGRELGTNIARSIVDTKRLTPREIEVLCNR